MESFFVKPEGETDVHVKCGICGSGNSSAYWDCGTFTFVKCNSCGHIYQSLQPVFLDLQKRYGQDYFIYEKENDRNFFELMLLGLKDAGFEQLEKQIVDRSFLDIGCATGMLLEHMKNRGWSVQGVEICRPSAEYGIKHRNVAIHVGTLEDAGFSDNTFSFIHFSHLIEHLSNPKAFLKEAYRVLKPSGYLIVVTPNVKSLQAKLFRQRWRSAIADHLHLFSKRTLSRILIENGFTPVKMKTWGGMAKGRAPAFLKIPIDRMAKLFGFGDVVLILAKK